MTTSLPPPPAVTCAENISLLYLLHPVPNPPSRNSIAHLPAAVVRENEYTLSLDQERSLVGTLAFLSNLKDGPEHIPAVCVCEDAERRVLNVWVAVNKAMPQDGKDVLRELEVGFERIFEILGRVKGDGEVSEEHVFAAIIEMCSVRILCRLRFIANNRKQSRQPIKELLQQVIVSLQQTRKEKKKIQTSKSVKLTKAFIACAREVMKLVDGWTNYQTTVRLKELVEGIHRLWNIGGSIGDVKELLDTIPNRIMDPSGRKNLLNTLSKVSRYREAARFLHRKAKKISLVRNLRIVVPSLPETAFQKSPTDQYTPSLPTSISRFSTLSKKQIPQLYRLLGTTSTEAQTRFSQQTLRTFKDAKIHAEIQLLFYNEFSSPALPPRVVCSTKDACFLCNAFIQVYGKIHTPRCHGRLYPAWRLPSSTAEMTRLREMEMGFNGVLAGNVRMGIENLLVRQRKTIYPDPAESTLLTLPVSQSTLRGSTSIESAIWEEEEELLVEQAQHLNEQESESESDILASTSSNSEAASPKTSEESPMTSPPEQVENKLTQSPDRTPSQTSSSLSTSSTASLSSSPKLHQSQTLSKTLKSTHTSPLYSTGNIEIQIEYSAASTSRQNQNKSGKLKYSLEWLAANEAQRMLEQCPDEIVSVEALEGEIERGLDQRGCFYLGARGEVVRVCVKEVGSVGVG